MVRRVGKGWKEVAESSRFIYIYIYLPLSARVSVHLQALGSLEIFSQTLDCDHIAHSDHSGST